MTSTSELTDVPLHPLPSPGPDRDRLIDHRLRLTRRCLNDGAPAQAATVLADSLRAGLWRCTALWHEFATLPHDPSDQVGQLWLDSPPSCHHMEVPLIVVARSAALNADHETARTLMRKAILMRAARLRRHSRRLRYLFKRSQSSKRATTAVYTATDATGQDTSRFFALYEAVATSDRAAITTETTALRTLGEGSWLDRL